MVTSRDVARAAGVSQATVSRVMSAGTTVSAAMRQRVLAAMESVGYSPNHAARVMRTGRSRTVGIVVADLENPFYPSMLDALTAAFAHADYRTIVWVSKNAGSDAALEAIREGSVDGVVFTTATEDSTELLSALEQKNPVVLVNRPLPGVDCDQVSSDNEAGAMLVARYLLDNDRAHVAFIGGTPKATTSHARLAGFSESLAAAGRPIAPESIVEGEYTYASGFAGMIRLLESGRPVDSVFCSNDILALGAIDAARFRGLSVPDDLWVIGYDDIPMAAWGAYNLTTVRQDVPATAQLAVDLLVDRIEGTPRSSVIRQLEPDLVVRASTAHAAL